MTVTLEKDYDQLVQEIASGVRRGPADDSDLAAAKERRTLRLLFDLSRALSEVHSLEDVSRKAIEILLASTQEHPVRTTLRLYIHITGTTAI